jgi:hypothetical protein
MLAGNWVVSKAGKRAARKVVQMAESMVVY